MEHREVEEGNITDLYIRLELSPDSEAAFEEHLLVCATCRRNLELARAAVEAINLSAAGSFRKTGSGKNRLPEKVRLPVKKTLQIAATVLIIAGLASLIVFLGKKEHSATEAPGMVSTVTDSQPVKPDTITATETVINKDVTDEKIKDAEKLTAENFLPDSFFENIISESVRHPELIILSPLKDTVYAMPEFRWKESTPGKLILVVFNNREKELFRKEITNGTVPSFKAAPGLYYWQLQDEEETLATGKICLNPPAVR